MKEKGNTKLLEHRFTNDGLFKIYFVKNRDLLQKLVAALLGVESSSIKNLVVINSEISSEYLGGKFVRLDINMNVDGQLVNLEIQVKSENFRDRSLYYWARNFSSSLGSGDAYDKLPRTICVSIIDEPLFDNGGYQSEFRLLETGRHELLTDKLLLKYFELPKLPTDIDFSNPLECWLSLFNAKTEDDLHIIERLGVPEMKKAVKQYHSVVVSDEFKAYLLMKEKAAHDEAQALENERKLVRQEMEAEQKKSTRKLKKIIADKDAKLADKDAEIAALKAQLASK